MNKILLAFTLLATGTGAFHSVRQHVSQLRQQARAADESWQIQTQQLAIAQSEQAALTERVRELKQMLAQIRPAASSALWAALQTNRADRLPPALRRQTLAELGFDWRTSPDFIVVSKQTVRDLKILAVSDGKLTDLAATVFTLTPEERDQAAAAFDRANAVLKDWVLAQAERREPTEEMLAQFALPDAAALSESLRKTFAEHVSKAVGAEQSEALLATATVKTLAHYVLPKDPTISQTISNTLVAGMFNAIGRERAGFILPDVSTWMWAIGAFDYDTWSATMSVKRFQAGDVQWLVAVVSAQGAWNWHSLEFRTPWYASAAKAFRSLFPNGWADVAAREGFELPPAEKK